MRVLLALLFGAGAMFAVNSRVCGGCHRDIYRRYLTTPMAQSSGPVRSLQTASFRDSNGIGYRIEERSFSFEYEGEQIRRMLDYYIGANVIGRSYLTSIDGFLFQSPISYYAATKE